MSRRLPSLGTVLVLALVLAGCTPQQPFYFNQRGEMAHYRDMATEIEYPDTNVESLHDVTGAMPPLTLGGNEPKEPWDLTLEEAIRTALCNNKIMKQIGAAAVVQFGGSGPTTPDAITRAALIPGQSTTTAPSVYDPAFNEAGVEEALSAFDAQFSSLVKADRIDNPENQRPTTDFFLAIDRQTQIAFQNQLSKINATGGTASITNNLRYTDSINPLRLPDGTSDPNHGALGPSDWYANVEAKIVQPLLRGAGVTNNRIVRGNPESQGGSIYNPQGVMIQRINVDISLANFENGVLNMVNDVETAYWELYFAYRALEATQQGLASTLDRWRVAWAKAEVGTVGGEAATEALTRDDYFVYRASTERTLSQLYHAEANLRYMMGIAVADGRIIRPSEEPTTAKVSFDWYAVHNEALVRNVNLRTQKWTIKKNELSLIAAKNGLLPQLDATALYRWLGLGNDLIGGEQQIPREFAVNEMLDGQFQEWTLQLQLKMPLGFRAEMANVRSAQLRLARERALLQEAELEMSHLLAHDLRELETKYALIETNFNRRLAAERHVAAWENIRRVGAGDASLWDSLSRAQREYTTAITEYFRSLVDYNKSIASVHLRKNSLLEYNNVTLAEGPWPKKAYFDASRLARSRDAAVYMDYGMTQPRVISRGPVEQFTGQAQAAAPAAAPVQSGPEVIPTPDPMGVNPKAAAPAPTPVPIVPTPAKPTAGAASAFSPGLRPGVPGRSPGLRDASAPGVAGWQGSAQTGSKGYDLGQMNLDESSATPTGSARPSASPVRPASYQSPSATGPNAIGNGAGGQGWTSVAGASAGHESDSNLSSAQARSSTPGWTRAER